MADTFSFFARVGAKIAKKQSLKWYHHWLEKQFDVKFHQWRYWGWNPGQDCDVYKCQGCKEKVSVNWGPPSPGLFEALKMAIVMRDGGCEYG